MQYLVSCKLRGNELCIPSTQNNDRFLSHPTQFQRHVKARQLELWPFWMPGLPSTAHQIHSKSEMSYVSEGISGIEYCCQYRPRPHHKRTCCGVPKSRMWLEGQICKGTSAPKTLLKLLVKCSNDGCAFRETREKMPQHKKSCSKREIPCKDCGDLIVWDSSQEHEQFQCTNATRPCPLGCGEIFPR